MIIIEMVTSVLSLIPFSFLANTFTLNSDPEGRFSILNWLGGCLKQNQPIQYHETKVIIEIQLYNGHPIKIIIAKLIVRIRKDHLHHHNCRSDPIHIYRYI